MVMHLDGPQPPRLGIRHDAAPLVPELRRQFPYPIALGSPGPSAGGIQDRLDLGPWLALGEGLPQLPVGFRVVPEPVPHRTLEVERIEVIRSLRGVLEELADPRAPSPPTVHWPTRDQSQSSAKGASASSMNAVPSPTATRTRQFCNTVRPRSSVALHS